MSIYHEVVMDDFLPDGGDEYKKLNEKLFVGITKFICKFELISNWTSNRELKDCLHASMHIPFYMTHVSRFGNSLAIDGAFSQNIANITYDTITVCPFSRASIHPAQSLTSSDCFSPASPSRLNELVKMGKTDYSNYNNKKRSTIRKRDKSIFYKCCKTILVSSLCTIGWILRLVEAIGFKNTIITLYCMRQYSVILFILRKTLRSMINIS